MTREGRLPVHGAQTAEGFPAKFSPFVHQVRPFLGKHHERRAVVRYGREEGRRRTVYRQGTNRPRVGPPPVSGGLQQSCAKPPRIKTPRNGLRVGRGEESAKLGQLGRMTPNTARAGQKGPPRTGPPKCHPRGAVGGRAGLPHCPPPPDLPGGDDVRGVGEVYSTRPAPPPAYYCYKQLPHTYFYSFPGHFHYNSPIKTLILVDVGSAIDVLTAVGHVRRPIEAELARIELRRRGGLIPTTPALTGRTFFFSCPPIQLQTNP